MTKRGRPSLADRIADSGPPQDSSLLDATRRLKPPKDLLPEERTLWEMAVYSKPAEWFGAEHTQMLRLYVQSGALAEQIGIKLRAYMKQHAADVTDRYHSVAILRLQKVHKSALEAFNKLGRSMRLTHQTAYRAPSAGKPKRTGAVYDEQAAKATAKINGKAPGAKRPWDH